MRLFNYLLLHFLWDKYEIIMLLQKCIIIKLKTLTGPKTRGAKSHSL